MSRRRELAIDLSLFALLLVGVGLLAGEIALIVWR
jgi:hypothetical protein